VNSNPKNDVIAELLARLKGVKESSAGWVALCPAHNDQNASLSIGIGDDDRILLHCHAGCKIEAVVAALGLKMADLMATSAKPNCEKKQNVGRKIIAATYDYKRRNRQSAISGRAI
jgi:hypothetical protein